MLCGGVYYLPIGRMWVGDSARVSWAPSLMVNLIHNSGDSKVREEKKQASSFSSCVPAMCLLK